MAESGLANEGNVLGAVAHIEAAEKILVFHGSRVAVAVVLQVLQVGFNQRVHVTHLRHEQVFALHDAVEYVIECQRGWRKRVSALSGGRGRSGRGRCRCRRRIQSRLCAGETAGFCAVAENAHIQQKKNHNGTRTND